MYSLEEETTTALDQDMRLDYSDSYRGSLVMTRVIERLIYLMTEPMSAVRQFREFRNIGAFPNDLQITDRDFTTKYMISETDNLNLYYGLEDGTFMVYYSDPVGLGQNAIVWREHGNGGYNVDGENKIPDDMVKYYNACVDEHGNPANCDLAAGDAYVECVDGCHLAPCPDQESQRNCSGVADDAPDGERDDCEWSIKWCPQYSIKTAAEGEKLGYIPLTYTCLNFMGLPEQKPGKVLLDRKAGLYGNCYHDDGVTIVNRNVTGDYEYCGGDGQTCSTTFVGGYHSANYDCRFRPWYIDGRREQRPWWADVYPDFSAQKLVMTYTEPLYYEIVDRQGKTLRIFRGLLAVDYFLETIPKFLISMYKDTDVLALIVEAKSPNYVVAASTGSSAVHNVLVEDNTKPCPDDVHLTSQLCTAIRVPIDELTGDPRDVLLQKAYYAQREGNFTREIATFKESDEIGSRGYLAQQYLYQQENANLQWRVIIALPMTRSSVDAALPGDPIFAVLVALGVIGFFACIGLFVIFIQYRKERAMISADWRFTSAFILGCAALNLSTLTLVGAVRDSTCMLRMWFLHGFLAFALSPLFVKVWRMYKLLEASQMFRRFNVNHFQAFLYTLPISMAEVVILTVFSFVDPPKAVEDLGEVGTDGKYVVGGTQNLTCQHKTNSFMIFQIIFTSMLILKGCILSYKTRDMDPKYGEAKQLLFSMYTIAFIGIVLLGVTEGVSLNPVGQYVLQGTGVLWGTIACSLAFVLPRLFEVQKDHKEERSIAAERRRRTSASEGNEFSHLSSNCVPMSSARFRDSYRDVMGSPSSEITKPKESSSDNHPSTSSSVLHDLNPSMFCAAVEEEALTETTNSDIHPKSQESTHDENLESSKIFTIEV